MSGEVSFEALNLKVQVYASIELFLALGLCAQPRDLAREISEGDKRLMSFVGCCAVIARHESPAQAGRIERLDAREPALIKRPEVPAGLTGKA